MLQSIVMYHQYSKRKQIQILIPEMGCLKENAKLMTLALGPDVALNLQETYIFTGNLHFYRKLTFLEISLLFHHWILLGGEGGAAMMLRLPHNFELQVWCHKSIKLWGKEGVFTGTGMNTFYGWNKGKLSFPGGPVVNPPANAEDMVRSLVQEEPTWCRTTEPMCHNYWALTPEHAPPSKKSHCREKPANCT